MATFKDKLSSLIGSQVPDFVLDDHPKFLQFLKTYYTFMEAAELSVTSVQTTDGVQLETETQNLNNLLLDGSRIDSDITPLDEGDKIILESSSFGKFTRGETIQGQTSKATSTIFTEDLDNNRLFIVAQDKFIMGETILGLSSNASAIVNNYRPNPVNNIQELLNFRDPDKVVSNFLSQFRNEFLTTLPENLNVGVDKRKLIKNIKSLYQSKGTIDGHRMFFKLLFNEDSETTLPREQILRVSDGKFSSKKIIKCIELQGDNNKLIGRTITGQTSGATAIVESVVKFIIQGHIVSEITLNADNIIGTFQVGEEIRGTASDEDSFIVKSNITGVPVSTNITNEGFLYEENDNIEITGGGFGASIKTGTTTSEGLTEIIIDNPGVGYTIGDDLVFNNTNTNGGAAAGFVKIVNGGISNEDNSGDRIILEDSTTRGDPYSGSVIVQESATGARDITDLFLYNPGSSYKRLPIVSIFTTTGLNATLKAFGSNIGKIQKINVIDAGAEYENSPSPPTLKFKTNLIIIQKTGTFNVDETVTSNTGATGVISRLNNNTGLITLQNVSGTFTINSIITGSLSGATATIKKTATATANVTIGALTDTDGSYVNQDGHVSEFTMRVQDSLLYQDFSYLIQVGRSISEWRDDFKKTMHTAGFYLASKLNIQSRINMQARAPVSGEVSGVQDVPIYSIINTLFSTIFGRRLGTESDGTTVRANSQLGINADLNTSTISPFLNTTRDVTLFNEGVKLDILSRLRGQFNNVTIAQGFVYAGPRYGTINREALRTFVRQSGTNYSIAELSANLTFGTRSSFDGQDNTFLFCSTNTTFHKLILEDETNFIDDDGSSLIESGTLRLEQDDPVSGQPKFFLNEEITTNELGRFIKTKLTIPAEILSFEPENQFDNTGIRFDQTIDNDGNPITFDDTTP